MLLHTGVGHDKMMSWYRGDLVVVTTDDGVVVEVRHDECVYIVRVVGV